MVELMKERSFSQPAKKLHKNNLGLHYRGSSVKFLIHLYFKRSLIASSNVAMQARCQSLCAVLYFTVVFSPSASAQVAPPVNLLISGSATTEISAPADRDPFRKGTWSIDFTTAYTQPTFHDRHRFVTGAVGIEYAVLDRGTISLEITGDYMAEPFSIGAGGGFDLRGRLELFKIDQVSFFAEGTAGIIQSDHPVPFDGTHFNFIETAGVGLQFPVGRQLFLQGGMRFEHISNAGISVNPGYNGVQGYLGICIPI